MKFINKKRKMNIFREKKMLMKQAWLQQPNTEFS